MRTKRGSKISTIKKNRGGPLSTGKNWEGRKKCERRKRTCEMGWPLGKPSKKVKGEKKEMLGVSKKKRDETNQKKVERLLLYSFNIGGGARNEERNTAMLG